MAKAKEIRITFPDEPSALSWPQICVCCCRQTLTHFVVSYKKQGAYQARISSWMIPCCPECSAHRVKAKWAILIALFAPLVAFLLVEKLSQDLTFGFEVRRVFALITCLSIPVLLLVLLHKAKRHLTSDCAKLGRAVSFAGRSFFFANSKYASAFMEQNRDRTPRSFDRH
jgi:hypothetical protein